VLTAERSERQLPSLFTGEIIRNQSASVLRHGGRFCEAIERTGLIAEPVTLGRLWQSCGTAARRTETGWTTPPISPLIPQPLSTKRYQTKWAASGSNPGDPVSDQSEHAHRQFLVGALGQSTILLNRRSRLRSTRMTS
jgi:hypothetical protein